MAREKELRRSLAVFPIGTVMKLTDLTARQIRYYEDPIIIIINKDCNKDSAKRFKYSCYHIGESIIRWDRQSDNQKRSHSSNNSGSIIKGYINDNS